MKNLYLSIIFFLGAFSCLAQTTKVFPDSVAYWREVSWGGDIMGGRIDFSDYLMVGDTSISGKKYKNLYLHRKGFKTYTGFMPVGDHFEYNNRFGLTNKIAAIRRDSLKVYIILENNARFIDTPRVKPNVEYLLMDFGWQPNDTIFSEYYRKNNKYFIIAKEENKIAAKNNSNDSLSALTFFGTEPASSARTLIDSNLFIKGMGFNSSIFFRLERFDSTVVTTMAFGGQSNITQFCSDGELIYTSSQPKEVVRFNFSCDTIDMKVAIGVNEIANNTLTAYPNPTNGKVILSGEIKGKVRKVSVSDLVGTVYALNYTIYDKTIDVDLSLLAKGIYFIKVETDKTTYLCKIIKQ